MELIILLLLIVIVIVSGNFGSRIGQAKGQQNMGFWLGTLFGPLGLIVACLLPENMRAESPAVQTPPQTRAKSPVPASPQSPPPLPGSTQAKQNAAGDWLDKINECPSPAPKSSPSLRSWRPSSCSNGSA